MENAQLTITDMISIRNIIDTSCTRGAFKAHEMKQVGELFDKLSNFIEATQAHVAKNQPPQGEANA